MKDLFLVQNLKCSYFVQKSRVFIIFIIHEVFIFCQTTQCSCFVKKIQFSSFSQKKRNFHVLKNDGVKQS